MVADVGLMEK